LRVFHQEEVRMENPMFWLISLMHKARNILHRVGG
jgi:hypothetical protein